MDPELISDLPEPMWRLYRGGAGPRDYDQQGRFIAEYVKSVRQLVIAPSDNHSYNLVEAIEGVTNEA